MLSTLGCWFASVILGIAPSFADDPSESLAYKPFATRAANFRIREKNAGIDLVFHEQSLLNWGNPARQQERGSVFAWFSDGRPRVIGSFFTYQLGDAAREKVEFHSLSEDPLVATYDGETVWTPNGNAITWRPLDDAPTPAGNDQKRLVQMRTQARRFGAVLVSPSGDRDELRLMTQPLLRYAAPKAKVLDGAIFSFVVATDPRSAAADRSRGSAERREVALRLRAFSLLGIIRQARRSTSLVCCRRSQPGNSSSG